MHKLLTRQLKKVLGCAPEELPPELAAVFAMVDAAYRQSDDDRLLLERSLEITSQELLDRNRQLRAELQSASVVIRQLEEARERLQLSERMASIGTLAAGVAHEINNPLAYVAANLAFISDTLGQLDSPEALAEFKQAVAEATDGVRRVKTIVRDLKSLTRGDETALGSVDLQEVLRSAIAMSQNEIRHRAVLVTEIADLKPVLGNQSRLGQVFLNLLMNAAQAIPAGDAGRNRIHVRAAMVGGAAQVEIQDTGAGMSPEVKKRIFDPFFTTKPVGIGTGLGLAICHGIVTEAGGQIDVDTAAGQGTTFRILLPLADGAPAIRELPASVASPGHRKLLLVDDEPLFCKAMGRLLSPKFNLTTTSDAREALSLIQTRSFDAILCDLMMPEMTGMDLHAAVTKHDPDLAARMIFLTGGAFSDEAREFLDRLGDRCIDKPVDPDRLRKMIDAVASLTSAGS